MLSKNFMLYPDTMLSQAILKQFPEKQSSFLALANEDSSA